ncbi:HD domain-containing phosphohydrolase [Mycobacterium sp. SMC-4]|uniref:HD domain-containing phosphohydrolase n=1 Tax=Mycobacterium sp. SMC-4 TaxID=2857059 RepID=UPI003D086FD3
MNAAGPTRAELLAALSVAVDLGLGQPAEHMLRSALIGTRIADRLGLTPAQRDCVYYTALVMWIGCHADSHEYAGWFGDDIAVRRDSYTVDWAGLPYYRFILANIGRGQAITRRMLTVASLLAGARTRLIQLIHSHCASASLLAERMGLNADVQQALGFTFERFDGGGLPHGAAGDDLPIAIRVAQLSDMVEVHHRTLGITGAVAMVKARRGGQFDPAVADVFLDGAEQILAGPAVGDSWRAALHEAPDRHDHLADAELDGMLQALGEFVDLKCPFTLGHSGAVADLAAAAAAAAGLDDTGATMLRRAGYVHDLGRIGVSNKVWSKASGLTPGEFEHVRLHPYLTVRILSRITGLAEVAVLAGNHHECVDGSGYPRGVAGPALRMPDRILAAAVSCQAALEPRPYRPAMSADDAERRLTERVRAGELDAAAVNAVLHAAGWPTKPGPARPDGLTPREIEVLRLVARGASNKEIAAALVISEKTARNHVERTYTKIGASNRIGASMYVLQNGLVK